MEVVCFITHNKSLQINITSSSFFPNLISKDSLQKNINIRLNSSQPYIGNIQNFSYEIIFKNKCKKSMHLEEDIFVASKEKRNRKFWLLINFFQNRAYFQLMKIVIPK